MNLRLQYLAAWKAEISQARKNNSESEESWKDAAAAMGEQVQSQVNKLTRVAMGGLKTEKPTTLNDIKKALQLVDDYYRYDLINTEIYNEYHDQVENLMKLIESSYNKSLELKPESLYPWPEKIRAIWTEIHTQVLQNTYRLSSQNLELARQIQIKPEKHKSKNIIKNKTIDDFKNHLITQFDNKKTIDQMTSKIQKISTWLTETNSELDFDSMDRFLKHISTYTSTKKQYIWSGREFWKWATKYDTDFSKNRSEQRNPFDGHELPRTKSSRKESYLPFTKEELKTLYSEAKTTDQLLADLIEIAAYTGCRLEEIGRIKHEDIKYSESVPSHFHISISKTKAGERTIPISSKIFSTILRLTKEKNDPIFLFKGSTNIYDNKLSYLSKRFGRLKQNLKFSDLHVFHSIRKTTATELESNNVPATTIPVLLGHKREGMTFGVYSSGPSLEQKRVAIESLDFKLNNLIN